MNKKITTSFIISYNVFGSIIYTVAVLVSLLLFFNGLNEFNLDWKILKTPIRGYNWIINIGQIVLGSSIYFGALSKLINNKFKCFQEIFMLFFSVCTIVTGFYSPIVNLGIENASIETEIITTGKTLALVFIVLGQFFYMLFDVRYRKYHLLFIIISITLISFRKNSTEQTIVLESLASLFHVIWVAFFYNRNM